MRKPQVFRSIRFRLTVVYSTLLFALAGTGVAVTYFAVDQTTQPKPITELTAKEYRRGLPVREVTVAEISQIESAVNLNTLDNLRNYSLIALGGLFILSLGIGWVLSGRVLRPVGAIARTARDIQATDLSRRINLQGPHDELRDLADTIDSMLDRLDDAFQAQRQLIDDASHELRSPLAIIRTSLDASLTAPGATPTEKSRAITVVDRATTRMSRLVEDLLATARRDADALADTDVDLAEVAREAGEEFGTTRFRYALTAGLHLIGDQDALRRAAGNLLSNAIRLTPPPAPVTIATGRTDSWLWLAVTDEGPGIAPEDLPRVFDRFWRGAPTSPAAPSAASLSLTQPQPAAGLSLTQSPSAGGLSLTQPPFAGGLSAADPAAVADQTRPRERRTGLGLAIVRQIVESHGGQVAAYSTLGSGSTFVLWLPPTTRTDDNPPPATNPWP